MTIQNAAVAGGQGSGHFFGILGVYQIVYAFQSFKRYSRFSSAPVQEPSPEMIRRIDEIASDIKKSKVKSDPALVEFSSQTFMAQAVWKGRLANGHAIFVDNSGHEVVFSKRGDVAFTPSGRVRPNKAVKGSLQLGSVTLKGTFTAESFERLRTWGSGFLTSLEG